MDDQNITKMNQSIVTYKIRCITGLIIALLMGITTHSFGQQDSFIADPANGAAPTIKQHIFEIEQAINHPQSWKGISLPGNHPAIGLLNNLIDTKGITSIRLASPLHLLSHSDGTYEVRDMYVKTTNTNSLEHRALALRFNSDAQLTGVNLLPDIYNYQLALDRNVMASAREENGIADPAISECSCKKR